MAVLELYFIASNQSRHFSLPFFYYENVHPVSSINPKSKEEQFVLLKEENRFCIKIVWDGIIYGIIDAGGFLFPQYIEKYLNLAIQITKFSALVFHNNAQYEKILESEKELRHMSFHYSMTGL
ncbi:hypothetical protein [Desulfitobacterium hafniense]|uniref:hypothetical protein n=1 Tax=Desulfitobacterium TaxID=36853 RepID=UPI001AD81D87|nr:hypothetical protein [Desulfitobacterium hafniense]